MKLSMWILADWLKKYEPVARIESGEQVLRGARILSANTTIEQQNVYLAPAGEFISDEKDKIICVQGHDILLLRTTDMDSVLNDIFDAFDYYNRWFDGLSEKIREGCPLQQLVDESDPLFQNPIVFYDASHIVTAYSRSTSPKQGYDDKEWQSIVNYKSNSLEKLEALQEHLKYSRFSHQVQRLNFPFFASTSLERVLFRDGIVIGRIIILESNNRLSPGGLQLLDSLGYLAEQWVRQNRESTLMRMDCEMFLNLLHGDHVSPDALRHKLTLKGWKESQEKFLARLEIPATYHDIIHPLFSRLEHIFPECYVFLDGKSIYILGNLSITDEENLCRNISHLQKQSVFFCGISYPFSDIMLLAAAGEQCSLALTFASGNKSGIYSCRDYALNYMKGICHAHINPAAVHPALKILRDNDRACSDSLYDTLYEYLIHNCNIAQTARILNLHRNSLLYRLNKIRDLTGICLEDSSTRQYLYLSYVQENP